MMVDTSDAAHLGRHFSQLAVFRQAAAGRYGPDGVQRHGTGGIHRIAAEFVQPQPADEFRPVSPEYSGWSDMTPPCARAESVQGLDSAPHCFAVHETA